MSRAYTIKVSESQNIIVKAEDCVKTHLEIIGILSKEETELLLKKELESKGFKEENGTMVRKEGDLRVEINPQSLEVTVKVEKEETLEINKEGAVRLDDDWGQNVKDTLEHAAKEKLKESIKRESETKQKALQEELTDRLKSETADLQKELSKIGNNVTREALKIKAATLGKVKEMVEDEGGGVSIKVEI